MEKGLPEQQPNPQVSEDQVVSVKNFISAGVTEYFTKSSDTMEHSDAKKFFNDHIETQELDFVLFNNKETLQKLEEFIKTTRYKRKFENIIKGIQSSELLQEPPKEEKIKEVTVPEHIPVRTEESTLTISKAEKTNLAKEKIEANVNFSELREANIAGNRKRVEAVYEEVASHETESLEYYLQFAKITKGGIEQVNSDFNNLVERKEFLEIKKDDLNEKDKNRIEHAKKMATITEKGIDYAISNLDWYGSKVNMKQTSEFSDVKRSVDNLLEITKEDAGKDFVGIATDVTFRRIEEKEFDGKFFKLLENIKDGYKTKVKYEKDSEGNLMQEFAVPKVLLHFEYSDIGMFMDILEKSKTETIENLKKEYEQSPQKIKYLQQIIHQCKILSEFAKRHKNNIFRRYDAIINSITELSWENEDIKIALETSSENKVSQKLTELIVTFDGIMKQS
ncbi:MAG: hypothetical protein ACI870_000552 [Crocinitomicaceae bacterium]|jgi:hypothetical protein